jgi:hypothetical protein
LGKVCRIPSATAPVNRTATTPMEISLARVPLARQFVGGGSAAIAGFLKKFTIIRNRENGVNRIREQAG